MAWMSALPRTPSFTTCAVLRAAGLVRVQQPVDPGAVGAERGGQLGDGHALGALGQDPEDPQPALKRQRGRGRRHRLQCTLSVRYAR